MSDKCEEPLVLPADAHGLAQAAQLLRAGGLVAVPTETVYGLAARADSAAAVAAIYRAKGRPDFNPLIVHIRNLAAAQELAEFDARAVALAQAFWPGALTMVLPLRKDARIATAVTAGLPTLALRCPAHPAMQALLKLTGLALAAPSANRSGAVSPTSAAHVVAGLGCNAPLVLDGGVCAAGLESTIVALRDEGQWQILRPGPVTEAQLTAVLGSAPDAVTSAEIEAPGQLIQHYSPGKPLRLEATAREPAEFLIGFGDLAGDFNLSPSGDLTEAAVQLYAGLHAAAAAYQSRIAVAAIPQIGIGIAINDRLRRAAA